MGQPPVLVLVRYRRATRLPQSRRRLFLVFTPPTVTPTTDANVMPATDANIASSDANTGIATDVNTTTNPNTGVTNPNLPTLVFKETNIINNSNADFIRPTQYDYAPSVILDGNTYRMWWCGSIGGKPGDHILYAEATSLDGPWHSHTSQASNTYDVVFNSTYPTNGFDGQDTCDPSVLRVNGVYYLYYGGNAIAKGNQLITTKVGLATSPDGFTWTRSEANPIVVSTKITTGAYGAGQPSVIYKDNMFYMLYTDTTGINGSGIFLLRSADPAFVKDVEEFSMGAFIPQVTAKTAQYPFRTNAVDVDWTYSPALNFYMVAVNGIPNHTVLYLYDSNFKSMSSLLWEYGATMDGPGLVVGPERLTLSGATCNEFPLDIMREVPDGSTSTAPYNGDLARESATIVATNRTCPAP